MEHELPTVIPVVTAWLETRDEVLALDAVAELIEEMGREGEWDEAVPLYSAHD